MRLKLLLSFIAIVASCDFLAAQENSAASTSSVSRSAVSSSSNLVSDLARSEDASSSATTSSIDNEAVTSSIDNEAVSSSASSMESSSEDEESVSTESSKREVLGWVERLILLPEKAYLDTKLTPGSEGNILHATNVKRFKRKSHSWVRFTTLNRKGEPIEIERELVNRSRFRTTSGDVEKRLVVKSGICLSGKYMELEFALSDRSNFEHEARIGRDALAGHFLVDPGRTRVTKPHCKKRGLGKGVDS